MKNVSLTVASYFPTQKAEIMAEIIKLHADDPSFNLSKTKHFVEDVFGKRIRYTMNPLEEDSLDMAIKSSKRCLEKANLLPQDIDMLVYLSVNPETYAPPAALQLHHHLNLKTSTICKNVNVNCVGMILEFTQCYFLMQSSERINNCLIVQSDYNTPVLDLKEIQPNMLSDASTALLLSAKENSQGKILDYDIYTHTDKIDTIKGPKKGFTYFSLYPSLSNYQMDMGVVDCEIDYVIWRIQKMLNDNKVAIKDIKGFLFSQYVYRNIQKIQVALNIPEEKVFYIGDQYGYTGASSLFVALEMAMNQNKLRSGDLCFFWSLGAGVEHVFTLAKI